MTLSRSSNPSVAPATDDYDPDYNDFGHGEYLDGAGMKPAYHFHDVIDFFDATPEGDFLSNFYPSRFTVTRDVVRACLYPDALVEAGAEGVDLLASIDWPDGETFFQAFKAERFEEVVAIATSFSPGQAKSLGRRCKMRPDWSAVRVEVMRQALAHKFAPGTELADRLLATETKVLIEGTMWHDRIWGVYQGEGLNLLGVLLMEQRGYLKAKREGR